MTKNSTKISTKLENVVSLVSENELPGIMGTAFSSFMLNPTVVWAKFVLTDDRKNGNGQRIPKQEFSSLIRSGLHMPVKMEMGEIANHLNSKPLGTITHLKEETLSDGTSAIVALAALWGEERPADVQYVRERFKAGLPVDVSWEILYSDATFNTEHDSIDLLGTALRAATIVADPAYEGRTPFLSVSAKKWSKAYINELPDSAFLYVENSSRYIPICDSEGMVDRTRLKDALAELKNSEIDNEIKETKQAVLESLIAQFESGINSDEITRAFASLNAKTTEEDTVEKTELEAKVAELQALLDTANSALEAKETAVAEKETTLATKETELAELKTKNEELETELVPLRELKASMDAAEEKRVKLEEVKNKFSEAEIEKDDMFFEEKAEMLIALSAEQLDFMIQELKVFAETDKTLSTSEKKKTKIPALSGNEESAPSPKEIAKYLRERNAKK